MWKQIQECQSQNTGKISAAQYIEDIEWFKVQYQQDNGIVLWNRNVTQVTQ